MERREEHGLVVRIDCGERLAVLDDDLRDCRQPAILEHGAEQVERLAADLVRLDVVGPLDELGDAVAGLVALHELLDLDRAYGFERHLLEILVRDHNVFAGLPLDRLSARNDLVVCGAVDLHLDARLVLGVQHVEADPGLGLGRHVELDRDGHQPELDSPPPHRARHGIPRSASTVVPDRGVTIPCARNATADVACRRSAVAGRQRARGVPIVGAGSTWSWGSSRRHAARTRPPGPARRSRRACDPTRSKRLRRSCPSRSKWPSGP